MSAFPSLPLFTDAFIADTGHLSLEQRGAYLMLLQYAWRSTGCRLPDDDAKIARMLSISAGRWAKLKPEVMAFWTLADGFWTQKRLQREYNFVAEKSEKKRAAGSQGGHAKALNNNKTAIAEPAVCQQQKPSKRLAPNPNPINTPIVPKGTEPEDFAKFRDAYPKRNTRFPSAPALKRWREAVRRGADPEAIIVGAKGYAVEQQRIGKVGTEFVQSADVWLNKQRWQDYATPDPQAPVANSGDEYLAKLTDDRWRDDVRRWNGGLGNWILKSRTPPPDHPETKVPPHILAEFGIGPVRARMEAAE